MSTPGVRIDLPGVRQGTDYTCGTACSQSLLIHHGKGLELTEQQHARSMGTNSRIGTEPHQITGYLRKFGLAATTREGMSLPQLKLHLRQRRPVVLLLQAWSDRPQSMDKYALDYQNGHWVVAIGYRKGQVLFMDPWIGGARGSLAERELMARWHGADDQGRPAYRQLGIVVSHDQAPVHEGFYPQVVHID